jgi:hypothetical protein
MRNHDTAPRVLCPQPLCLLVRPMAAGRWLPTGFRSRRQLRRYLVGSDFLMLSFGQHGTWLIAPDGLLLEVLVVRPTRGGLAR